MTDCESCKNYDRPTICTTCENGSDFERIVQTNADKIRAMSDEELAEYISKYFSCEYECAARDKCGSDWDCKRATIEWLQSEVE